MLWWLFKEGRLRTDFRKPQPRRMRRNSPSNYTRSTEMVGLPLVSKEEAVQILMKLTIPMVALACCASVTGNAPQTAGRFFFVHICLLTFRGAS
jgi:hypothetical protein